MDILLTHGYFLYEDPAERQIMKPYPPLGLLYISSYLKSKGLQVELLDTTFSTRRRIFAQLDEIRPKLVGIYCNMMTKFHVLAMIEHCKRLGAIVILGGPEPANYAREYLESGADIVVFGEGEKTLEQLIAHIAGKGLANLQKIDGIAYLSEDGRPQQTPARKLIASLDPLPFPDRGAIDLQRYLDIWQQHHGRSSASLITARGCPYTCTWCSHSVFGVSHRRRSPRNVAEEVAFLAAEYRPDMLWYADDVFTIHHGWFFEYAAELARRNLKLPFECISRENRLNEEVIAKLADIGCFRLWIGSESGSQRILDAMQRKTNAIRVREMTKLLQKYGIEAGMFIMLGYEGETWADLQKTADHLRQANPDVFLTTVSYPIKGTRYFEEVEKKIHTGKAWHARTDRDLEISGRRSRRFYRYASRWLVSEVARQQLKRNGSSRIASVKAFINAQIGRLGMALTFGETNK